MNNKFPLFYADFRREIDSFPRASRFLLEFKSNQIRSPALTGRAGFGNPISASWSSLRF